MWCKQYLTHIILVAAEGLWHLGSLFIMTHCIHKQGDLQIYFGVIFRETRHHAQAHVTSGALVHCAFSLAARKTHGSGVGWMISLASAGYGESRVAQHLLRPHLVIQPIWGWGDLGSFQLLQSNSSPERAQNLGG
jgi:hypothetical protein